MTFRRNKVILSYTQCKRYNLKDPKCSFFVFSTSFEIIT